MDKLLRLIDANLNRSQEGLRVCEDITRFFMDDRRLARSFKAIRHSVYSLTVKLYKKNKNALSARNVRKDIGRVSTYREKKRKDIIEVFRANIQRVKESLRVLEEISKLFDEEMSERFKAIRFKIYEKEKESRLRLEPLLHN